MAVFVGVLQFILYNALLLYFVMLWGRFALDLYRSIKPGWRPGRAVLVVAEIIYTLTDPPIRFFRRILPPVRIGAAALDFGWSITMFCVLIAMTLVSNFVRV